MASSSSSSPEISASSHSQSAGRNLLSNLNDVLDDLSSRFILNLPDEELTSLERICFQVEQAHWFYEDFIREEDPRFPSLPLKKFSELLFQACPLLHHWSGDHEGAFNHFMQYKTRVPVCGAIMLNDTWDKVVLVKGWKSSSGWGFPKGKINQGELPHACAVREVAEETGYSLGDQIDPENVIQMSIREQLISLYIVPGVPQNYKFETKTRKEISKIQWFDLTDLPTWKRRTTVPGKFYLISPFIGPLKAFIHDRKPRNLTRRPPRTKTVRIDDVYVHEESDNSIMDYHAHNSITLDSNVQESGSQSSSADNGDPQTPSPLYSEAVAVAQIQEPSPSNAVPIDPHFTRLISALVLSAKPMVNGSEHSPLPALSLESKRATPGKSPSPPIVSDHSSATQSLPQAAEPQDWSMRGPRRSMERLPTVQPLSRPSSKLSRQSSTTTSLNTSNQRVASPIHSLLSSPPPSATLPTSSSKMSASSPKRSTITADISPYLSRPVAVPMNGKRLKQLALLESVADESARMSPVLRQRVYNGPTAINGSNGAPPFPSGLPPPPLHVPPHSTSVPPPNFHNLSSMYPHTQGHVWPYPNEYQTPQFNHPLSNDNPFTVRPRTSNAFHPIPNPPPPRRFNTRGSMNQAQLLSALSGGASMPPFQRPPLPPMGAFAGHPPPPPTFVGMGGPVFPGPQNQPYGGPPQGPLRVVPPYMMSGPPPPGPLSAPAQSPTFDIARGAPGGNAHLLNILNTRGPGNTVPTNGAWMGVAGSH